MKDQDRTKEQLTSELAELRQRVAELEVLEVERKETEKALRRERDLAENLVETAQIIVLVLDIEGRIVRFNPYMEEISGYQLQEVRGKDWFTTFLPERDWDRIRSVFQRAISGIQTRGNVNPIVTKDGREREIEWYDTTLEDVEGNTIGLLSIGQDITEREQAEDELRRYRDRLEKLVEERTAELEGEIIERKQAEEALLESERRFREVIEYSQDALYKRNLETGRYEYMSPAIVKITGYTPDEVMAMSPDEIDSQIHPEDMEWMNELRRELLEAPQDHEIVSQAEYRVKCKDGSYRWISDHYTLLRGPEGCPLFSVASVSDITERRQADEALRESEEKFRNLAEQSPNMIFINKRGKVVYANRRCEEVTRYTRDEFYPTDFSFFTLIAPEYRELIQTSFSKHIEGEELEPYECALVTKDGERVEVIITTKLIDYEGERAILGIVTDVTECRQTEEALRVSEERFRTLVEQSTMAIQTFSTDGTMLQANKASEELWGVSLRPLIGIFNILDEPQATITDIRSYFEKALAGEPQLLPEREYDPQEAGLPGRAPWLRTRIYPVKNPDGTVQNVVIMHEDITAQVQAEKALRESEERFRVITENTTDITVILDQGGVCRYTSPSINKVIGCSPEEVLGKTPDRFVHPDDMSMINDTLACAMRKPSTTIRVPDFRMRHRDGHWPYLEGVVTSLLDVPGVNGVVFNGRDITERKRAEEERERLLAQIREQAQRAQLIMDTVPEGVLLLDTDGRVMLANPVAERELFVLADVEVGNTLTHLGDSSLDELLTSPPRGLWHEIATDGRSLQVIARPLETRAEPGGWVMVIRDVTQQREIERRIQQQERLATVGQLAAGIAHDFNNIMATIVLYAQMTAREESLPAHVRERMETINQQTEHATRLIQQILDFGRRAVLERRPLDLALLLKEHVKLLERTLPESIQIELTYGPDEYMVNADPTRMQQMITNLALNARDAMTLSSSVETPEGGILRIGLERIEVRPGESPLLPEMQPGEWVQVMVSDTGTGIPPDVLPHIFEPFFTTRAPLGSGLGLPQVYGIVGQHGGRIDVETQLGQGTTFTIYLPALPVHPPEPFTGALLRELPALPTGEGETVLVVEDDAVVRKALTKSLEVLNYQVLEAANGQEALVMLEQRGREIDLLLSDVVMPEMGGMALLHALRERGLAVPVVMLTGHPLEKELESLRAQGMIDWLPKPPMFEQLAEVVSQALNKESD